MQSLTFGLHDLITGLLAVVTVVAIITLVIGTVRKQAYGKRTHWMMLAFSGLTTLQWIVGSLLLIALGNKTFGVHCVIMTAAVVISYLPLLWRKSDDAIRSRRALFVVIAVPVLMGIGIVFLW